MKFEAKDFANDFIIYCKDDYYYEADNNWFYYNISGAYFKGYEIHRKNKPAIEHKYCKSWYIDGKKHRDDGPAVEYGNGYKYWYLNGKEYSEEEYLKIMNLKKKNRVLDEV